MLICILGNLKQGSVYGYRLMDTFMDKIFEEYPLDTISYQLKTDNDGFQSLCGMMAASLFGEVNETFMDTLAEHEDFQGQNQIIYAGISTNGLPVAAKLFENQSIMEFESPEKMELIRNTLSGQLATIAINAFIRAQCFMDSIQIKIIDSENQYLFLNFTNFGRNQAFTFETLSTGNPTQIKEYYDIILRWLTSNGIFETDFSGALKQYSPVQDFFNQLKNIW